MPNACIACRFFCAETAPVSDTDIVDGQCRRHPPKSHYAGDDGGPLFVTSFPEVYSNMWCGDFVARLAAEPLAVYTDLPSDEPAESDPNP